MPSAINLLRISGDRHFCASGESIFKPFPDEFSEMNESETLQCKTRVGIQELVFCCAKGVLVLQNRPNEWLLITFYSEEPS